MNFNDIHVGDIIVTKEGVRCRIVNFYFSDENRMSIAYHQFCDLAKALYNTARYGLFKVLRSNQLK